MKITIFTSNQPRHISLVNDLSNIADEVFCIQECNTVFPGVTKDFFSKSETMKIYFEQVKRAEEKYFGQPSFFNKNVRSMAIKSNDLSNMRMPVLQECLESDIYIVFGASFIRGWLIEFLEANRALNIHMGLSPFYRGSSCNFWALYDNRPSYVGATIHMLTKGLDSGPILYHCIPHLEDENPFEFTMKSVSVAHESLVCRIQNKEIFQLPPVVQCKNNELRYSINTEFTDEVAREFLDRRTSARDLSEQLATLETPDLLNPYFA
jgi:methionyl-tRNA formyltransferase